MPEQIIRQTERHYGDVDVTSGYSLRLAGVAIASTAAQIDAVVALTSGVGAVTQSAEVTFTETTGAGTYTGTINVPAGAADEAYIRIPPGQDDTKVVDKVRTEWSRDLKIRGRWRYNTASRLLKNNTLAADLISRFVLLSSLVALGIRRPW